MAEAPLGSTRRALLVGGAARLLGAQSPGAKRALALIGDRYHNADYIHVALTRMFQGLGVAVDYTVDYDRLSSKLLRDYQLFLCLRDGMIWPDGYLGPDAYTAYEQGLENRDAFPEAAAKTWLHEDQAVA